MHIIMCAPSIQGRMIYNSKEFLAVLCSLASNKKVKLNQKAAFNRVNVEGFSVLMAD